MLKHLKDINSIVWTIEKLVDGEYFRSNNLGFNSFNEAKEVATTTFQEGQYRIVRIVVNRTEFIEE